MNSQSGSAHVVIISVLVVALVGVLGVQFWQNVINKNPAAQDKGSKSQTVAEVDSTTSLKFTAWNTELPLESKEIAVGSSDAYKSNGKVNGYDIIAVDGAVNGCYEDASSPVNLGTIFRYDADSTDPYYGLKGGDDTWRDVAKVNKKVVVIDDYAYYYQTPMQGCGDPSTTEGDNANAAQEALSMKIADAIKSLKSTN